MNERYMPSSDLHYSQEVLNAFNNDIIDYLYNLEPASNNLFWAGNFCNHEVDTGKDNNHEQLRSTATYGKMFSNAQFRIQAVSFNFPKFEYKEHEQLRIKLIDSISDAKEVTIEWKEDVWRSVQKYHLDWQNRWYDRHNDVLRVGPINKYRGLDVVLFHYIDSVSTDAGIVVPHAEPICMFRIRGLTPQDIGDMNLKFNESGNADALVCKYGVNKIEWLFNENLIGAAGQNYTIADMKDPKEKGTVWNPSIGHETADAKKLSELGRIQQTLLSTLISEGVIT